MECVSECAAVMGQEGLPQVHIPPCVLQMYSYTFVNELTNVNSK